MSIDAKRPGLRRTVLAGLYVAAATLPMLAALSTPIAPASSSAEFATALGLTGASLLLLQFLSSGRFEFLSGRIGIDRTMGFHRIAAVALLIIAVLHPLFFLSNTVVAEPLVAWNRLMSMLASSRLRSGVLAMVGIVIIVGLATIRTNPSVRYEYWRTSHGLLAILVTGLVLHHALTTGTYSAEAPVQIAWLVLAVLAGGAIMLTYVIRPWRMWREGWCVERVQRIGAHIIEMGLRGPARTKLQFHGGQFIWLAISPNRPPFHDHPFSIASGPADLPKVRLIISEAGDCTSAFEKIAPGTPVALDGPHGSFMVPKTKGPVVMIAGGVGIAPLLGMLEEAAANSDKRPFRLLYAARNEDALVCTDRLRELQGQLALSITYLVDEPKPAAWCKPGPLTLQHLRELIADVPTTTAVALVCGPSRMMEFAADGLLDAGFPPNSIFYERFDYGAGSGRLDRKRRRQALLVFAAVVAAMVIFGLRHGFMG